MVAETIPGLSMSVRDALKRRAGGGVETSLRIDELSQDDIYREAPNGLDQVVKARPTDPADIHQWERYQAAWKFYLSPSEIRKWVSRLLEAHDLDSDTSPPSPE